jgi:hypothetical protein
MDIFQKLYEIENETGGDVSGIKKLIEDGQVTIASSMPSPDPKDSVRTIELINSFMAKYPPGKADGGRIGFYKGMSADKSKNVINLRKPKTLTGKAGDRKLTEKQIKDLDPNYLGDFEGGDLERPKKVYQSGTPGSVLDDAIEIRNIIVNNKGNIFGLEELGEKAGIYTSGTGSRKSGKGNRPDIRRVRAALAVAKDSFPEIGNFKFVTDRYKIDGSQRQQLNMVVDTIKAYQSATGDEKLAQFLPDNMGQFYTRVIEKGSKKLPGKPEQGLYIKMYNFGPEQIKYISDRISYETGQKFTSKDYKNLVADVKKYRASVGSDARVQKKLATINKHIKNLANDSVIQDLLKGNLDRKTQEALLERATRIVGGDASIASRRLFMMAEAMSDTTDKYKNLGIELNNEKANKIIATGKEIGGRNNRYGMSSVLYDYYGNVVDKAIGSGEGQTFLGKYQQAIRNALDKGQSPDEIFSLTASARTRVPGQGNLAPYAIFTQRLKTEVNSAIKGAYIDSALSRTHGELQKIFKGRKYSQLNAADKKAANDLVEAFEKEKVRALNQPVNPGEVKKGAKPIYLTAAEKKNIQLPSFDLKNPPSKSIEGFATRFVKYPKIKEAFEKSYKDVGYSMKVTKDMQTQKELLKTIASQYEKLGCGKAAGGRVYFNEGGLGLTECAKKGKAKLENIIKKGVAPDSEDAILARQILKAGASFKDAFTLRGMFGPAAMAFLVGTEAGFVGYDMLSEGKTMREAVGDSLFNYMLGEKTKINPQEELFKRYRSLGYDDNQMFRLMKVIDTTNLINRGQNIDQRARAQAQYVQGLRNEPDQFMGPDDQMMSDTRSEMAEKGLKDLEQEALDFNKSIEQVDTGDVPVQNTLEQYIKGGQFALDKELLKEADAAATVQKMQSPQAIAGGFLFPKLEEKRIQTLGENLPGGGVNPAARLGIQAYEDPSSLPDNFQIIPLQPYGLKKGGRAGYNNGKLVEPVEIDFASAEDKAFSDMMKAFRYYIKSGGKKSLKEYMRMSTGAGRKGGGKEHFRGAGGGIAKLAGVDDGPPPKSGPNPQGLSYLMKRGKNT